MQGDTSTIALPAYLKRKVPLRRGAVQHDRARAALEHVQDFIRGRTQSAQKQMPCLLQDKAFTSQAQ